MTLGTAILLFLPLAAVIAFFCSALRRTRWSEIVRATVRLFVTMTVTIFLVCAVLHVVMEWVLDHG